MTIIKLHTREMYWQKNQTGGGLFLPRFGRFMSRDRFNQILRALHFNDNSTAMPYGHADFDKLHKIRPLLDAVNKSFSFAWNLGGHVSVDEGMVGFRGRSYIRQFMPAKKTKYGLKNLFLPAQTRGSHTASRSRRVSVLVIRAVRTTVPPSSKSCPPWQTEVQGRDDHVCGQLVYFDCSGVGLGQEV
jgi:hypothetical protein